MLPAVEKTRGKRAKKKGAPPARETDSDGNAIRRMNVRVPAELHARYKRETLRRNLNVFFPEDAVSMQQLLIEAMTEYAEREKF